MSTRTRRLLVVALATLPLVAMAGQQMCGRTPVPSSARRCPDGSIPVYVADGIKPYVATPIPSAPPARQVQPVHPGQQVQPAYPGQALPAQPPVPTDPVAAAGKHKPGKAADLNSFFGVWRTNIPGAVWTSPSGYPGQDWLHVSAGAAAGDLIIKPDGSYVWASYGGKSGRWVKGDAEYPLVLIDTVENRRWRVGPDARQPGRLLIWDGSAYYYHGRR